MWWRALALILLLAIVCGRVSDKMQQEETVYCPETGSYYEFVRAKQAPWEYANQEAARRTFRGRRGHLATITSQEENEFLRRHFARAKDAWIGASDREEEGVWKWVTGPEAGTTFYEYRADGDKVDGTPVSGQFADWHEDEPNNMQDHGFYGNFEEGEDYAVWNWHMGKGWNDLNPDDRQKWPRGFIVEYSAPQIEITTTVIQDIPALTAQAEDKPD